MTVIACVAIVCATALVGLSMYLRARRPQVTREELKGLGGEVQFLRDEVKTVEGKLVQWGQKLMSVEKIAKLAKPEPVIRQPDAAHGPPTRKERQAAREVEQ